MDNETSIFDNESFCYHEYGLIDSPEMFKKILDIKNRKPTKTNLTAPWSDFLIPDGVGEVKVWLFDDPDIVSYLCYRIAELFPKLRTNKIELEFQVMEWQEGSFIPWHIDDDKTCALTCYLESNIDHGGEFLCKPFTDQTLGMFLEPIVNRTIFIKNVPHCVTKINKGTRTTLQVWGLKKDADL